MENSYHALGIIHGCETPCAMRETMIKTRGQHGDHVYDSMTRNRGRFDPPVESGGIPVCAATAILCLI